MNQNDDMPRVYQKDCGCTHNPAILECLLATNGGKYPDTAYSTEPVVVEAQKRGFTREQVHEFFCSISEPEYNYLENGNRYYCWLGKR